VSDSTKTETPLVTWLNIVTIVARSVRLLLAYMREDVHATRQLHCQWWSGQCHAKHAENVASVRNTCLDKIVCYLHKIFNRNRKLKQISKYLSVLKLGVCSKIKVTFSSAFSSRYAKTRTSNFRKVVRQHTEVWWEVLNGFVGNLPGFPAVKGFWKSVKNWQSYRHEFGVLLFGTLYSDCSIWRTFTELLTRIYDTHIQSRYVYEWTNYADNCSIRQCSCCDVQWR